MIWHIASLTWLTPPVWSAEAEQDHPDRGALEGALEARLALVGLQPDALVEPPGGDRGDAGRHDEAAVDQAHFQGGRWRPGGRRRRSGRARPSAVVDHDVGGGNEERDPVLVQASTTIVTKKRKCASIWPCQMCTSSAHAVISPSETSTDATRRRSWISSAITQIGMSAAACARLWSQLLPSAQLNSTRPIDSRTAAPTIAWWRCAPGGVGQGAALGRSRRIREIADAVIRPESASASRIA